MTGSPDARPQAENRFEPSGGQASRKLTKGCFNFEYRTPELGAAVIWRGWAAQEAGTDDTPGGVPEGLRCVYRGTKPRAGGLLS